MAFVLLLFNSLKNSHILYYIQFIDLGLYLENKHSEMYVRSDNSRI
jgi:hypothetical protein